MKSTGGETHALEKAGLLAEVGDPRAVVVREHLVAEDRVRDLGRVDEVHLEQARLERALLGAVLLERVEQERGRLLDHVLRHEDVHDALNVDQRAALVVDELPGELGALVRVQAGDVLQERRVVGRVVDPLGVDDDLGELSRLGEAGAGWGEAGQVWVFGGCRCGRPYTTLLGTFARR